MTVKVVIYRPNNKPIVLKADDSDVKVLDAPTRLETYTNPLTGMPGKHVRRKTTTTLPFLIERDE